MTDPNAKANPQDTDTVLRGLLYDREGELRGMLAARCDFQVRVKEATARIVTLRREVARLRIALGMPVREPKEGSE